MNKAQFLECLRQEISEYPVEETSKSLEYYTEMIDDRIEDGMTEDEAVASLGSVKEIVQQIKCELPLSTLVRQRAMEKTNGGKIPAWVIVLMVLGAPLWFPLVLVFGILVFTIFVVIFTVGISFWICDVSFAIAAIACLFEAGRAIFTGSFLLAVVDFGVCLIMAGLTIIFFVVSFLISKGLMKGIAWSFIQLKKSIIGKKED